MLIGINKAHFPVTVLGPGRRLGIWLQGCSIRCRACVSQDTWEQDAGCMMPVDALLDWCRGVAGASLDGVTFSGGEPFDQPQALDSLLRGLIDWRTHNALEFDLLCYSGRPMRELERRHAGLLALLDAVIPEPFIEAQPTERAWCGSDNQTIVPLSALGIARYGEAGTRAHDSRLQIRVDAERIWYIGIPRRGDMALLERRCAERGLEFKSVSWRA